MQTDGFYIVSEFMVKCNQSLLVIQSTNPQSGFLIITNQIRYSNQRIKTNKTEKNEIGEILEKFRAKVIRTGNQLLR